MTAQFDPDHRWLGIPPKHQPADRYRLLGIDRFEDDREVIIDAAERQIRHVRSYALGQYSDISQNILNELARAKACLFDPAKRAEYDGQLRESAGAVETARTRPVQAAPAPVIVVPQPRPEQSRRTARTRPVRHGSAGRGPTAIRGDVRAWLAEKFADGSRVGVYMPHGHDDAFQFRRQRGKSWAVRLVAE